MDRVYQADTPLFINKWIWRSTQTEHQKTRTRGPVGESLQNQTRYLA